MYDVVFLDRTHQEKVLATGLDHDDACDFARAESQRRGVGRMFLAGSDRNVGNMIVIVESGVRAA